MNVFILQIIAMVTMLSDHIGGEFLDNNVLMRSIGRFAFPIYAFLLAEGYRHIRKDPERVSRHLGGYIVLALVSEFCYDLLEFKPMTIETTITSQSALITLLIGFLGLMAIDKFKDQPLYKWSAILLTACANFLISSNYRMVGVLLVYVFYFYLNKMYDPEDGSTQPFFKRLGFLLLVFIVYLPIYHWARYGLCSWSEFLEHLDFANRCWYATHAAIAVLLATYNGKLGPKNKGFKLVYKVFYPAHLLILGILHQFTNL